MNRALSSRCLGAGTGLLLDRALGEPPAPVHPVARFGLLMQQFERAVYRDDRARGVLFAASGALVGVAAGRAIHSTSAAVGLAASGRMLRSTARDVAGHLADDDLDAARATLRALVGRDASSLDHSGVAAAVIESLAENTVDAVVAPALWGAAFGAPGAVAHRAMNTLDAMVGHRSPRYRHFGTAAARLDDMAAYLPARATALLVCLGRPARASCIVETIRRDAGAHPSPNAGVAEAAFAAALGLELGGPLRYGPRVEDRPRLGSGPRPGRADIARAIDLANRVELLLATLLIVTGLGAHLAARAARRGGSTARSERTARTARAGRR